MILIFDDGTEERSKSWDYLALAAEWRWLTALREIDAHF